MTDKTITFDRHNVEHGNLMKLHKEGYRVICPLCKSDIVFSENSGSWCSKNPNHYETHIYRNTGMRNWLDMERKKKKAAIAMKKKGYTEVQIQEHLDKYYPSDPQSSEIG